MAKKTLDELFSEDDDLGLLDVKPVLRNAQTDDSRILSAFEQINVFIDRYKRTPGSSVGVPMSLTESNLQMRLGEYRKNASLIEELRPYDRHNLFEQNVVLPPATLDEILDLEDDLLSTPADHIFQVRPANQAPAVPDKVAERRPCSDFASFKPLFARAQAELRSGVRKAIKFSHEQSIKAGEFFILNGVTAFVAEINNPHIRNGKPDARLRVIFENGTEGENLLRSLASKLYGDPAGRRLTDPEPLKDTMFDQPRASRLTGCIYVVKSLSANPEIARYDGHLFKIGFTGGKFEERIRGAKDDPTFLLSPVHPVKTYDVFDLDPNALENLLHRFFASARLDIEMLDRFGKPFRPREWFLVPLESIDEAVNRTVDRSIVGYRYDRSSSSVVAR